MYARPRPPHATALRAVGAMLLSAVFAAPVGAQADDALDEGVPLTLETLTSAALENAASIDAVDRDVDRAEHAVSTRRVGLWPTLSLEASYARIGGFDDGAIETPAGQIAIEVPRNRLRFRARADLPITAIWLRAKPLLEASRAEAEVARHDAEVARADTTLRARLAYFDYLEARAREAVATRSLARAESVAERVAASHEAGLTPPAEVLSARAGVAEAEARRIDATARTEVAAEAIARFLGVPATRWSVHYAPEESVEDVAAMVERALEERAELVAMHAAIGGAEASARAQRAGAWPTLGAYGLVDAANPNPNIIPPEDRLQGNFEVGVFARWSTEAMASGRRSARAGEAAADALRARRDAMEEVVEHDVRRSHANLRGALARTRASEARVDAAQAAYEARVAELEAGRAVTTDVVTAEASLAAARTDRWRARADVGRARALLDRAVGR